MRYLITGICTIVGMVIIHVAAREARPLLEPYIRGEAAMPPIEEFAHLPLLFLCSLICFCIAWLVYNKPKWTSY